MIRRYSSRRESISLLDVKLKDAVSYDRIAGYFSSSILEVAGEAIENMEGKVRVVCNSQLEYNDVITAKLAQAAIRKEWCDFKPEELPQPHNRFKRLYEFLSTGKLEVRVVPNNRFGLIHGKAGVITYQDGSRTSFLGSTNETYSGWKLNYELVWEDSSDDAVSWVQEEFDALWDDPSSIKLSQFIIEDIKRISKRKVIKTVQKWKENPEPAATVVEAPVYRQKLGLWEHQKYFVDLAFRHHKSVHGARYVLADQVGLGKTLQLAMAAQLMALYGEKPVLVIAPKTLLWQWQNELNDLLDMPSAVWDGRVWVDENGISYPNKGEADIKRCPRRVGIISQGMFVANSPVVEHLLAQEYECVIVDEAHRARRKNVGPGKEEQTPAPTNLYHHLLTLSKKTKSLLLATATPIQIHPLELWDLLNILSQKNESVLGSRFSNWRNIKKAYKGLKFITGEESLDFFDMENWEWIKDPFPPATENEITFGKIRRSLNLSDDDYTIKTSYLDLSQPDQARIGRIIEEGFYTHHNPFIRHVVRRERSYLEEKINQETGEPYLKKIRVKLYGESKEDALELTGYLKQAYELAEEFCNLLSKRLQSGGFLKTLLLKRIGSSIAAGLNTGRKLLANWELYTNDMAKEEDDPMDKNEKENKKLTTEELDLLMKFVKVLEVNTSTDPKYNKVVELLKQEGWMEKGCIIFSQYLDTARWVAENLSKEFPGETVGLYAGSNESGTFVTGEFTKKDKRELIKMVEQRKILLLIGTDSASEGLNLQTLGTSINLDLPWNPTKLEQRKGRIQRIGQVNDEIYIYNLRYKESIEDRVHELLSQRLKEIMEMFGQIPDVLEDVWVYVALNDIEKAKQEINNVPEKHPFRVRYNDSVEKINWESYAEVLSRQEKREYFKKGWKQT